MNRRGPGAVVHRRRRRGVLAIGSRGPLGTASVHGSDAGVAAVLVLTLACVLALVAGTLASLAAVGVARQRAASAADLAALAAADAALSGEAAACGRARTVVERVGGQLGTCALSGDLADVAEVTVQVRPAGPLGRLGFASVRARAGPGAPGDETEG